MIKRIHKNGIDHRPYICGLCGRDFSPGKKGPDFASQKQSLRASRQIKVGNEPVLVLPRVCYRCDGKVHDIIISTVEKTEFTK